MDSIERKKNQAHRFACETIAKAMISKKFTDNQQLETYSTEIPKSPQPRKPPMSYGKK